MFQSLATNGLTYFFFAVEVNDVWWFISLTNISPSCTFAFFLLRQKKNLDKTIYSPALKDEVSQAWVGGWITPTILTNIRVGRHFQGCGGVGGTSRGALLLLQELGFLVNCCWSSSGTMKSTANIAGSSGSTVFWGFCTYINLELSNTIFPICSTAVSLVPQPTCKVKWGPCRHCC